MRNQKKPRSLKKVRRPKKVKRVMENLLIK